MQRNARAPAVAARPMVSSVPDVRRLISTPVSATCFSILPLGVFLPAKTWPTSGMATSNKFFPTCSATGRIYLRTNGMATLHIRIANAPNSPAQAPICRAGHKMLRFELTLGYWLLLGNRNEHPFLFPTEQQWKSNRQWCWWCWWAISLLLQVKPSGTTVWFRSCFLNDGEKRCSLCMGSVPAPFACHSAYPPRLSVVLGLSAKVMLERPQLEKGICWPISLARVKVIDWNCDLVYSLPLQKWKTPVVYFSSSFRRKKAFKGNRSH